jgi:hypothetical protein
MDESGVLEESQRFDHTMDRISECFCAGCRLIFFHVWIFPYKTGMKTTLILEETDGNFLSWFYLI